MENKKMAMKQTQTKLFDFSDVGLDFCAGSKNLFPDRFKKMLTLGYNEQTVASVSVSGNQITFEYGVSHGYVADRVIKVASGALTLINDGEFWIDSVTVTSITMTIDGAPSSITGGFITKIAPLGWSLEYENANIHIYKFKQLNESDMYLRLCFQNNANYRNCIAPCVGRSFDVATGGITDKYALQETKNLSTPHGGFKWEFSASNDVGVNNYTYTQGFSSFGKAIVIGSKYHFVSMHNTSITSGSGRTVGVLPSICHDYEQLDYPVLIGESVANPQNVYNNYQLISGRGFVGNIRVAFDVKADANGLFHMPQATGSFLGAIDPFNITTASAISIYDATTFQHYGFVAAGLYVCKYSNASTSPSMNYQVSPILDYDADLSSICMIHHAAAGDNAGYAVFLVATIEEVKYA